MKHLLKRTGVLVVLFSLVISLLPSMKTYAGGIGAAIVVQYVFVDEYGECTYYEDESFDWEAYWMEHYADEVRSGNGYNQTVEGPEGTGETSQRYGTTSYYYYIEPTAGTYTLTDIRCPKGYVVDTAATTAYPLSVTITKADVKDYKENWHDGDGTKEFSILVPIKEKGTKSVITKKPSKEKLSVQYLSLDSGDETLLEIDGDNYFSIYTADGSIGYEVKYATKKNGTYKKLCTLDQRKDGSCIYLSDYSKIKNGKTYYFKARAFKKLNGKKIYGAWSSAKKVNAKITR